MDWVAVVVLDDAASLDAAGAVVEGAMVAFLFLASTFFWTYNPRWMTAASVGVDRGGEGSDLTDLLDRPLGHPQTKRDPERAEDGRHP